MNDRNELLDAVDDLTFVTYTKVTQDIMQTVMRDGRPVTDDNGNPIREAKGKQRVTLTAAPLLHQLEEAIASTIGAGAGRAMTAKFALSVLDSGALHQFTIIDTQIRDWCRMIGVTPTRHPAENLRAWYAATLSRRMEPAQVDFYTGVLTGWAGLIRAKLNPPRTMELTAPCPECGATEYTDEDGDVGPFPVKIEYWDGDVSILERARATCRACDATWKGARQLRELRWDVDQADTVSGMVVADVGDVV